MNWIKKLFGKQKEEKTQTVFYKKIEDVLNDKQKEKAESFYFLNKEYVELVAKNIDKAYEPSQAEDKNDPRIWKAEYWKWFLTMRHQ